MQPGVPEESASEKKRCIHPGTQMYGTQAEPELLRSGSVTGGDSPGSAHDPRFVSGQRSTVLQCYATSKIQCYTTSN